MLFFGENSVVGLDAVFGEEFIVALGLDVYKILLLVSSGNIGSIDGD
jgi:hypothetical protein